MNREISGDINQSLDQLGFDFSSFTMSNFVSHIEQEKGRRIFTTPWDMPTDLFGAWFSDAELPVEYIFFDKNVLPIHQIHIQLHELCHYLCGHTTLEITSEELKNLLSSDAAHLFQRIKMRSPFTDEEEYEVEHMANLIQTRVIAHRRLEELVSQTHSSSGELMTFLQVMGLSEDK